MGSEHNRLGDVPLVSVCWVRQLSFNMMVYAVMFDTKYKAFVEISLVGRPLTLQRKTIDMHTLTLWMDGLSLTEKDSLMQSDHIFVYTWLTVCFSPASPFLSDGRNSKLCN